jgi:thiol-disulfide isomerase/thioredoxin
MKYLSLCLILICSGFLLNAQTHYTLLDDEKSPGSKYLYGFISKYRIENDPAYNWYNSSRSSYTPERKVLNAMEASKSKIQFIIFGGTWCEDTQFILPKFFKLQELSGFPDSAISLLAVNRKKKTPGNLADAMGITNVPTIIIMKEGKEKGRIVEYGKTGKWDEELASLLMQL